MRPLRSKAVEQTTLSSPLRMMRQWWLVLTALCLAACAQFPATTGGPQPTEQPTEQPIVLGPPLEAFIATGRIALRQEKRSDHLRFRWQHTAIGDTVLFMSPLGSGVAEITHDADSVRLTRPDQPPVVADSLPELAQHVFGVPLPLDALADWLRGARPELSGVVDGWRIEISDTSPFHQRSPKADSRLLRVATISRGDVELKLIVDDWDAGSE
jgi:outer membrane lipoprotein LolB